MKLGIHAYAWCSQWSNETLDLIDRVKGFGMDFIEIPLMCLETFDPVAVRERLESVGLESVTSTVLLGDLRELNFLEEEGKEKWAGKMGKLLREANAAVNERKTRGFKRLKRSQKKKFENRYERITAQGFAANPPARYQGAAQEAGEKEEDQGPKPPRVLGGPPK